MDNFPWIIEQTSKEIISQDIIEKQFFKMTKMCM